MDNEEKKVAAGAFMAAVHEHIIQAGKQSSQQAGWVKIDGLFNLEVALEAAFAAANKHKAEMQVARVRETAITDIFDP